MRAAVYLRISEDREGKRLGVDRQREHCQHLADRLGATVLAEYCDNDRSASTLSKKPRPDFQRMIAAAERGEYDAILSYSTSRLTRRPMEIERIIPLGEQHGVKIHTVKHGDYDLNSARGRRRAREDAARDAEEVEEAAERIRDEVLQRAAQGRHHGGPKSYGFDGAEINEAEANEIRSWVSRVLAGGSIHGIVLELNRRGVPAPNGGTEWRAPVVRRILLKPRIAGLRVLHGSEYPAVNPPIVEVDTWRAVVRLVTAPDRLRPTGATARKHLGTGLFVCERCAPGTVNASYNPRGGLIYRCLKCFRSWLASPLDEWIIDLVADRFEQPDFAESFVRPDVDTAALKLEERGVRTRLTQLAEEFADGALTADQLRVATARLRARLAQVEEALADAANTGPLALFAIADDPVKEWRAVEDLHRRRAVIARLMTVVLGPPIRGRAQWDPRKFLGSSRWNHESRTWAEVWAEEGMA